MEFKQVFVSSENRDIIKYPYGNSYTLHLTNPIEDIVRVELLNVSIPNTMYNLPYGTNVIQLSNIISNHTDPLTTFSLPEGFYSGNELLTQLNSTISNVSNISVSYQTAEGKFLFTRPIGSNTFAINVNSTYLATMLGVEANVLYKSQNVAVQTGDIIPLYSDNSRYRNKEWIKSTKIINLSPNQGVFLDIEELRTSYTEDAKSITGNTYSGRNITRTFGLIPMDVDAGSIKNFKKYSDYDLFVDYPTPIRKLDRLTVRFTDRYGELLQFNGLEDNSFLLRFHTLKKTL